jgi:cyclic beta-1,2-glucan synthetase
MPIPRTNPAAITATGDEANSLEQVARDLAARHDPALSAAPAAASAFYKQLEAQRTLLKQARNRFRADTAAKAALSYGAEWLLDNYYLLVQAMRQVGEDLPASYLRELPRLQMAGPLHGYPRVFDMARVLTLREGASLDLDKIVTFVAAYQEVQPLAMGELWALPIMLRVVLLESVTQATARLTGLLDDSGVPPAFELDYGIGDDDVVAATVPALHRLSRIDWREFFEELSLVEQILGQDPAGLYHEMTFATRDRYRKVVESLALAVGKSEREVARQVLALAEAVPGPDGEAEDGLWAGISLPRELHVGYYLLAGGRPELEAVLGYQPARKVRLQRWLLDHPTFVYLGATGIFGVLLLGLILAYGARVNATPPQLLLIAVLAFIPLISVSISLVNWAVTTLVSPRVLPKLDFSEGIPAASRTMVVVPAMLTSADEVESLLGQLERHYLRNPDPMLSFALLTDYGDAKHETMPDDEMLLAAARAGIARLNDHYPGARFYIFHRRRLWNPQEEVWMGWERKRGKLHEFNRLLRGAQDTSFMLEEGLTDPLAAVRYVITLDADTILPRDAAARLVGTLAHPLNRARFAEDGQVADGYTVLQPRTEIQPASANQSLFTRVFAGDTGIDLYTLAVSDVYQDLFGEGIFVGKGIYDVDAFERSVAGRIPENALLSHDLFEGIHGRVALVSDIVLYEDYPPHYLMQVRRNHRWVRGDWQLLPWLRQHVPVAGGGREPNRLTLINRWKIVDNLRRSLYPLALLLFFVAGWTALPGAPAFWTLVGLLIPGVNLVTTIISGLIGLFQGGSLRAVGRGLRDSALRWLLFLAFLPYEALLNLDAVLTTVRRVYFTHRHLLHWTTAAHTVRLFGEEVSAELTWRDMVSSLFISLWIGLVVLLYRSDVLAAALPLLLLWLFAPQLAFWISRPARERKAELSPTDERRLRRVARRTWFFYERFVGPDDHWLPPDHFQEAPRGVVARRTSPTNVGLYLLSALAAYDFGYLDPLNFALRLQSTFNTLARLDRYRGHFLNWIDTATLAPLPPRYISTVDSGNLAGSLIALRQACLQIPQQPAWRWARWQGLLDNLDLLGESLSALQADLDEVDGLAERLDEARSEVLRTADDPRGWHPLLRRLRERWHPAMTARLVEVIAQSEGRINSHLLQECRLFADRLDDHLQAMERQITLQLPWLPTLGLPPAAITGARPGTAMAVAWESLQEVLVDELPSAPVDQIVADAAAPLAQLQADLAEEAEAAAWLQQLADNLRDARLTTHAFAAGFADLARRAGAFVDEMDFSFLYDRDRKIFHIGFNLDANRLDNNYYDLLASEARIASLVAIAKHDIPNNHWLHLSRPIAATDGGYTLLSWSGTMFEYLMPPLLMRSYRGTLLDHSERQAVKTQIDYGRRRGVPWGVSESGFYTFDAALNYQYQAFGVPGLGLKRGLGEDLVIAPYASLLALPIQPQAVLNNMDQLERRGMLGQYGFYEAIDFTESRLELTRDFAIVQSYMSHHQGMIMLALANHLHDYSMVTRFHADPRIQAVDLLLQEQLPQAATLETTGDEPTGEPVAEPGQNVAPWSVPLDSPFPLVHYLSNGEYGVLFTNDGGGYSHWGDLMLTRWRPDVTRDHWGQWLYLQDEQRGVTWSAGLQPTGVKPDRRAANPEILYHPHMIELHRRDHDITLRMEIVVPPSANLEIRRVTLDNDSDESRQLRLTTYAEVALAEKGADWRHPAFAKLFVESEYLEQYHALIFRRRPRASSEEPRYMAHMLVFSGANEGGEAYESDRARFLGRGRTAREPAGLNCDRWLTGTTGATLDPAMSLGQRFMLEPRQRARVLVLTAAASSREELLALLARYQSPAASDNAFAEARARAERLLRRLEIETPDLQLAQRILSLLFYPHHVRRAPTETLAANEAGQPGLWPFAISGDNPILLVTIGDEEEVDRLQTLVRFHNYWRRRGLMVDLVILNTETAGYAEAVQAVIYRSLRLLEADSQLNRRGGIFVLKHDQLAPADRRLLLSAARVVLAAGDGSLAEQLDVLASVETPLPAFTAAVDPATLEEVPPLARPTDLQFDNGYGGFSPSGDEYVIYLAPGTQTPAPWINVVANEMLGFLASETGGGYTWAVNSGENRLTTWRNDPVTDLPAEVIYLRDEETAEIWSPTPQPAPAAAPYLVRHGAGYTIFEHDSHGLHQELRLFIAPDEPVKILELRLENRRGRVRRLTASFYAEPVLGTYRGITQQYLIPRYDPEHHALLVRNPYQVEFGERVAFFATNKEPHGLTADRTEFLGRLGSLQRPAALERIGLDDRVAAGRDICAALQLHIELPPGGNETIYFLVGQGADLAESERLLAHYRDPEAVRAAWHATRTKWDEILGAVQVQTPDRAMDLLLNRWLLYQALSCRVWGRSALYQSSGAYGFRDQLQDVMALVHSRPDLARAHIVRAAAHQFEAGDVLHWWHPPSGRGVRTRISDDLLWLPFVTAHYVATTGDTSVLDEEVPFLRGEPLAPDEDERYGEYEVTAERFTIFEHCQRALRRGSTSGPHNLPLMGGGDWNDGMNRVGHHGRGESVWLAWFLEATLTSFAALCEHVSETALAADYRRQAGKLREAAETAAWDGSWYLRAWYDDGTPLGSRQNRECQIDAIAQSWSVLSGAAAPERARRAMQSVRNHLVREEDRLLLLFTPPFDQTPKDPGYIKGYLPGIRENGGQYTHAALWTIWAFAELGDGAYAESLFRLANPIYRAATQAGADHYKAEPYVIAADVYGVSPHEGRGGWTWYTGSSGWMYRLGLEGILGLRRENGSLRLQPRIPPDWPGFAVRYQFGGTLYEISVDNLAGGSAVAQIEIDGQIVNGAAIPLTDDGTTHEVRVRLGREEPETSRGELASD